MGRFFRLDVILFSFLLFTVGLFSFFPGSRMYYSVSPLLVCFSALIIIFGNKVLLNSSLSKTVMGFIVVALLSSYHYLYFSMGVSILPNSYCEYVCYSVSILFVFLSSYVFSSRRLYARSIFLWFGCVYFACALYYNYYYYTVYSLSLMARGYVVQYPAFYYALMPLPLVFLSKNSYIKISCYILSLFVIIFSLKRSGILCVFLIGAIIFYLSVFTERRGWLKMLFFSIVAGIGVFIYAPWEVISERWDFMMYRLGGIAVDEGSGRVDLLKHFFDQGFKDLLSFPELFLGNGFLAFYNNYRLIVSYHNDVVEVLYSFGLMGLCLLLAFYFQLLKRVCLLKKHNSELYLPYLISVVLFFVYAFSGGMFFFMQYSIPCFMFLGYSESEIKRIREC